jgi:hypothetical protein
MALRILTLALLEPQPAAKRSAQNTLIGTAQNNFGRMHSS